MAIIIKYWPYISSFYIDYSVSSTRFILCNVEIDVPLTGTRCGGLDIGKGGRRHEAVKCTAELVAVEQSGWG